MSSSVTLRLRPATAADLPAVLALVGQVVPIMQASGNLQWSPDYPNAAVFEQDLAAGHLWAVELSGEIVGVAALTRNAQDPEYALADWDPAAPAVVVHRLAVAPAAQGRGVAQALLAQAETLARAWGYGRVRVDTNSANTATQRLFPKLGYRFAGEIALAFRPGLRFFCYERLVG